MNLATQTANSQTISSLDLVDIINRVREEEGNRATLRHDDFLKKIRKVLGDHAGNFSGMISVETGKGATRESPCYRLPKREAELMVLSESYKVQAAVYDRMQFLEARQKQEFSCNQEWIEKLFNRQQMLSEQISGSINVLHNKVGVVQDTVSDLCDRVIRLEQVRPRREIGAKVKSLHLMVFKQLGCWCPIENKQVKPEEIQFDHFFTNQHPDFSHTWPLSKDGHAKVTRGLISRAEANIYFNAYQQRAKRILPEQLGLFG